MYRYLLLVAMQVENESKKMYIILTKCINWIYVSKNEK